MIFTDNPELGDHGTFSMKGDVLAARRLEFKKLAKEARRAVRHAMIRRGKTKPGARPRSKSSGSRAAQILLAAKLRETKVLVEKQP